MCCFVGELAKSQKPLLQDVRAAEFHFHLWLDLLGNTQRICLDIYLLHCP